VLKKVLAFAGLMVAGGSGRAMAQEVPLSQLIPSLFGTGGLHVQSTAAHDAHFLNAFQTSFTPFNTALASQLAAVPLPSPASGFTYTLDASLGVFKRSTQSFGPILSDRADTVGKHKLSVGFSYQHFNFDSIDGVALGSVPVVFEHQGAGTDPRFNDVVTTANSIQMKLSQFTTFLNYGLADRLDVSVAIPVVSVDLTAGSIATIQRISTANNPGFHYFDDGSGSFGTTKSFAKSAAKSGIGDVILRLKGTVYKEAGTGLALGGEVRLPTGDEANLLGSGATGAEGFVVFSSSHKTLSPHVKLAYQWNGNSILAGDVEAKTKGNLPDQVFYEIGADLGVSKNLTLAVDFLGRRVIDGERMVSETFTARAGGKTFPNVIFEKGSFNVANGSVGFKFNPGGNLLLDVNVLFKLNDAGLRDKITPLVGFEYSF
jgi:hypothetical protein